MDFTKPNREQRQRIFNELLYEIEMFVSLPMDSPQSVLHNALSEAYLLHARVLVEFFQDTQRTDDQVLCSDFGFPPAAIDPMREIESRHHMTLSHLTYRRASHSGTSRSWLQKNFGEKIQKRITAFLLHVLQQKPVTLDPDQTARCVSIIQKIAR